MKLNGVSDKVLDILKKRWFLILVIFSGISFVTFKILKSTDDFEVGLYATIKYLVIVVFTYVIFLWLMCRYADSIKANKALLVFTIVIMSLGSFIQIAIFELDAPVRNVLDDLFVISEYENIVNLYKNEIDKPVEENEQKISQINALKDRYENKYGLTVSDAKGTVEYIKNETGFNFDEILKETIKDNLKSKKEKYEEYKKENKKDKNYIEKCKEYEEKINELQQEVNKIPSRHYLITETLYSALDIRQAEKIDVYLSESSDLTQYQDMVRDEKKSQYNEKVKELVINMMLGVFLSMVFMVLFCLTHSIYYDLFIHFMIIVQAGIFIFMYVYGKGGGASISYGNINILEFVKILFVFVIAGLLCKPEKNNEYKIMGLEILKCNRVFVAVMYLALNCAGFLFLSELGTLVSLFLVSVCMFILFTDKKMLKFKRSEKIILLIMGVLVLSALIFFVTSYNYWSNKIVPDYEQEKNTKANYLALSAEELEKYNLSKADRTVIKVCQRVYAFIHINDLNDKFVQNGSGAQYLQILKARASTDISGPVTEDMDINIIENNTDMVFAQFIHTSGYLLAMVVIVLYFLLIFQSYLSVMKEEDKYYKGLGLAIVFLLAFQNILHIAVNISLFPITGVPLMYVSHGGSIQAVSMIVTFLILIISNGEMQRDTNDEKIFETKYGKCLSLKKLLKKIKIPKDKETETKNSSQNNTNLLFADKNLIEFLFDLPKKQFLTISMVIIIALGSILLFEMSGIVIKAIILGSIIIIFAIIIAVVLCNYSKSRKR